MSSVPDFPWGPLDLDPVTATERDVKRAYARLIKVHRPDTDPECFRSVHEAYQAALAWLRAAEDGPEAEPVFYPILEVLAPVPVTAELPQPAVSMVPVEAPGFPMPQMGPELSRLVQALLSLLAQRSLRPARAVFQKIEHHLREHSEEAAVLDAAFFQQLKQTSGALAKFLTPKRLLMLVQCGSYRTAELVLLRWHLTRQGAELGTFLKLFLRQSSSVEHIEALDFQLYLAELTVFIDCERAEQLTNRIFPHLSPVQRKLQLATFEKRAAMAKIFAVLPLRDRLFWETKLYPSDNAEPIFDRRVTRWFYKHATTICPSSWPGWKVLGHLIPSLVLDPSPSQIRNEVTRLRIFGFKQSEWRHLSIASHLKNIGHERWKAFCHFFKRLAMMASLSRGMLLFFGIIVAIFVAQCHLTLKSPDFAAPPIDYSKPVPLPPELQSANGEYELEQLVAVKERLARELAALPGFRKWASTHYEGKCPDEAWILVHQQSKVIVLLSEARARKRAPVLIEPD